MNHPISIEEEIAMVAQVASDEGELVAEDFSKLLQNRRAQGGVVDNDFALAALAEAASSKYRSGEPIPEFGSESNPPIPLRFDPEKRVRP